MAHVAVIGAGPSGITTIKELMAEGHSVSCYEKAPGIGGLFRYDHINGQIWKSLTLTSSKPVTGYSDFPMPEDYPLQISHEQYLSYLNDYCDHFKLHDHIAFNTEVTSVDRQDDGSWTVGIKSSDGIMESNKFDAVAICSGVHQHPYSPELEGHNEFKGEFLHASKYRSAEGFEDRSVVFVGLGESGSDIIGEIAKVTSKSYLSVRRGAAVTPRIARGLPTDYRTTRLIYALPKWFSRPSSDNGKILLINQIPIYLMTAFTGLLLWPLFLFDAFRELRYKWRFAKHPMGNKRRVWRQKFRATSGGAFYEQFGTKSDAFIDALIDGTCEHKPNIERLTPDGVRFVDGTEVKADTIIFCTGYKPHFPFMAEEYNEFRDPYVSCFLPSVGHTLGLIGCARPAFGAIPPVAELQARWFAQLVSGVSTLPSEAEMRESVQKNSMMSQEHFRVVNERLFYLIEYPAYMDLVAGFVGCKPSLGYLMRHPLLMRKVYCCPFVPTQFRLEGPHAKPELAKQVILKIEESPFPNTFLLAVLAFSSLLHKLGLKYFKPALALPWQRPKN